MGEEREMEGWRWKESGGKKKRKKVREHSGRESFSLQVLKETGVANAVVS